MPLLTTIAAVTALSSMGLSIGQAAKAHNDRVKADREADRFMEEARKKLDVNYYESLAIQKEPYELEREATLQAAATAIEAGQESERGAAATAGRIMMASNKQQGDIRSDMAQEKALLDEAIVKEETRLMDERRALDLGEVEGAQIASKEARMIKDRAIQNAFSSLDSALTYGDQLVELYPTDRTAKSRSFNFGNSPLYTRDKATQEAVSAFENNPDAVAEFESKLNNSFGYNPLYTDN